MMLLSGHLKHISQQAENILLPTHKPSGLNFLEVGLKFTSRKGSNMLLLPTGPDIALWVVNSIFVCSFDGAASGLKEGCQNSSRTRHGCQGENLRLQNRMRSNKCKCMRVEKLNVCPIISSRSFYYSLLCAMGAHIQKAMEDLLQSGLGVNVKLAKILGLLTNNGLAYQSCLKIADLLCHPNNRGSSMVQAHDCWKKRSLILASGLKEPLQVQSALRWASAKEHSSDASLRKPLGSC